MMYRTIQRYRTWLILGAILINLLVLLYLALKQQQLDISEERRSAQSVKGSQPISDVTILLREFENFENDIVNTVFGIQETFPNIDVMVIGDKSPYPPWNVNMLNKSRFRYISLEGNLWESVLSSRPELLIKTEFVFLTPDATKFPDGNVLKYLANRFLQNNVTVLAVPFKGLSVHCGPLTVNVKEWILGYSEDKSNTFSCNNIVGEHAVFMRTKSLFEISLPYLRPWPLSLYIQGSLHHWTIKIIDTVFLTLSKQLYGSDAHHKWKHKHNLEQRTKNMYKLLGIKLVIHGRDHKQWHGCSKETERCFDTVIEDMPEYLFMKRWTPPCCLKALRETARHVFEILDLCSSRYWLEGGSLLGAARHNDIIPWDYDVDIGIYLEDVDRCDYLLRCKEGTYVDEDGFVWERAREGDFYRVQYSESNRLHVDIFPFFSSNGIMTKNTWIKTHRQDTEFPERFLRPLTKIRFAGMNVNAPNNVREFLEFKFGPGVIEHPKYPNSQEPI